MHDLNKERARSLSIQIEPKAHSMSQSPTATVGEEELQEQLVLRRWVDCCVPPHADLRIAEGHKLDKQL